MAKSAMLEATTTETSSNVENNEVSKLLGLRKLTERNLLGHGKPLWQPK